LVVPDRLATDGRYQPQASLIRTGTPSLWCFGLSLSRHVFSRKFQFPETSICGTARALLAFASFHRSNLLLLRNPRIAVDALLSLRQADDVLECIWRGASGWRLKIAEIVSGISDGLQAIRTFADLAMAILYSAIHWTLIALIYLWVAHSFGGQFELINFKGAMLVLAITMVGSTLQVPGVGGGSQAASFLAFTQFFGVEKEPAAAAAIVLWLVTFVASSLGGVPLLVHEGLSLGKLRHLAEEAPLVAKESRSERDRWSKNSEPHERRDRGAPTE
jgi:uncharacterized membrane protein YbhN (UPF0104 family)